MTEYTGILQQRTCSVPVYVRVSVASFPLLPPLPTRRHRRAAARHVWSQAAQHSLSKPHLPSLVPSPVKEVRAVLFPQGAAKAQEQAPQVRSEQALTCSLLKHGRGHLAQRLSKKTRANCRVSFSLGLLMMVSGSVMWLSKTKHLYPRAHQPQLLRPRAVNH